MDSPETVRQAMRENDAAPFAPTLEGHHDLTAAYGHLDQRKVDDPLEMPWNYAMSVVAIIAAGIAIRTVLLGLFGRTTR